MIIKLRVRIESIDITTVEPDEPPTDKPPVDDPPVDVPSGDIKIGVFGAFTGVDATWAVAPRNAAKLAVKQHNAKNPDVPVTLLEWDTEGKDDVAVQIANEWAADPAVLGVIGGLDSRETAVAIPIFDAAAIAMVSPSASRTDLTTLSTKGIFHRIISDEQVQGRAVGRYLTDVLLATAISVLDDGSQYGSALADEVANTAPRLVRSRVQPGAPNYNALCNRLKQDPPDVVFYSGDIGVAPQLLKDMVQILGPTTFVGGDRAPDATLPTRAGGYADGALLVSPCVPAPTSGDFAAAYDSEYQAMPGPYAAEGYDATNVLLDAIAAGKRTRADVLAFVKTYDHRGVTKTIRFDATGELVPSEMASWLFKVNGTQLVPDRPLTTT